jgi:hypothetical protein
MEPRYTAIAVLLALAVPTAHAAGCNAQSGEQRTALLELYTSEGCDSCPPADRWLSGLTARGHRRELVVPLAFHVDYWDRLGWRDPYADARHTARQRELAARGNARFVYTPQFALDGRDYRRGLRDDLGQKLTAINAERADTHIKLTLAPLTNGIAVNAMASAAATPRPELWLARYEMKLTSTVNAGENRGKVLQHDYVVRELAGPFATNGQPVQHRFALPAAREWGVAAFVQAGSSGDIRQALALPGCF